MKEERKNNLANGGIGRRETLKKLGATSLAIAAGPTVLGTVSAESTPEVMRLTGTYKNPVTLGEIQGLKRRLTDQAESADRVQDGPTPVSGFGLPDGARIIDYVVTLAPDGTPVEHADIAGDDSSVTRERGREQTSKIEAQIESAVSDDDFSTQASVGTDWNRVLSNSYAYREDPYGEAFTSYVWWRLNSEEEPAGRAIHSAQHHGAMTPGTKIYGSEWHNEWLAADTYWDRDYPNQDVETWDPSSPTDSSDVGVSVGYPASGSLSWTFENAGCIEPSYDSASSSVHWELHCVFGEANRRENTISIKPGSRAQMDDSPNNCYDGLHRVCELSSTAHFENWDTSKYWLRQNAWFGYNC